MSWTGCSNRVTSTCRYAPRYWIVLSYQEIESNVIIMVFKKQLEQVIENTCLNKRYNI